MLQRTREISDLLSKQFILLLAFNGSQKKKKIPKKQLKNNKQNKTEKPKHNFTYKLLLPKILPIATGAFKLNSTTADKVIQNQKDTLIR